MINNVIKFFLSNKLVTVSLLLLFVLWGIVTSPFHWKNDYLPSDPVPVDAIPDIGENQQIVFTKWMGRSPQDIEDQITYPITTFLLGIPGVKTIRGSSMFGLSSIYIIFEEDIEFYWSRSRILEKLNSISKGVLPQGVQPALGPDATALGQIYWYTLEGRDEVGKPTGGWDLHEVRSIQDYYVKYALSSVKGVSEVASIGGFVKEYQIDVNPSAMKAHNVNLLQIVKALKNTNKEVGAKTMEINNVEYFIRGLGYVKNIKDIEETVVRVFGNTPIKIKDVAKVYMGPAERRGILDKSGVEVAGGVVVARYGSNPMEVINKVKEKIEYLSKGMPSKILEDGRKSTLTVVPFYDRTGLINETLGTLEDALSLEILITILVIIVMVLNLRASVLVSSLLPIAVLMVFVAMKYTGVDANIVALSGIAIAIGTMVDIGVVISENILKHIQVNREAKDKQPLMKTVYNASVEVAPAIITAILTTVISFIPVFTMEQAEGKLFSPLAYTKTYSILASLVVSLMFIPLMAYWLFGLNIRDRLILGKVLLKDILNGLLIIMGLFMIGSVTWAGITLLLFGVFYFVKRKLNHISCLKYSNIVIVLMMGVYLLADHWLPLGVDKSVFLNFIFVFVIVFGLLSIFGLVVRFYDKMLLWALEHKVKFLMLPLIILILGITIWMGFDRTFGWLSKGLNTLGIDIQTTELWSSFSKTFPGVQKEFMPDLNEGSYLLMPTSMAHSGIAENKRVLMHLDMAVASIPEVEEVIGKAGRVESAIDPAPLSMYENVINYKPEYIVDGYGRKMKFAVNDEGLFLRKNDMSAVKSGMPVDKEDLIVDAKNGKYYRNWRDKIRTPNDIWDEIVAYSKIPGVTSAPKLQPIKTRLIMLQTGIPAPMGIKISGNDLQEIENLALELEEILKEVPAVRKEVVFAQRIVGKPYINLKIDRQAIARYGLTISQVQSYIETAIGGISLGQTVEGRERYAMRIRYPRELRSSPEDLENILIGTPMGNQIPLGQLVDIEYNQGPQVIKSENTFLSGYVLFDKAKGYSEVNTVESVEQAIQDKIKSNELVIPKGMSYTFIGNYQNQLRAEKRLSIVIPLVLVIIFMILYLQFRSVAITLMVFSGILVAFAGGFMMIWLYDQDWFLDFKIFGVDFRDLFQVKTINLSVAVWVGFIALFGIATDDGVIMATYLNQQFKASEPKDIKGIRKAVIQSGKRRIKPCLMTTATTILALLPVLTSSGKGSNIMIPMAIPSFGGMMIELITLFVVSCAI